MVVEILIIAGIIAVVILGTVYAIHVEKKEYNKGVCPHCGKPLEFFTIDSSGARGYMCDDCRYYAWISYDVVDKDYKGDRNG